jgi:hypothetical protein
VVQNPTDTVSSTSNLQLITMEKNLCNLVRVSCRQYMLSTKGGDKKDHGDEQGKIFSDARDISDTASGDRGVEMYSDGSRSVRIHIDRIPGLAKDILHKKLSNPDFIEWDEESWHYSGSGYLGSESQRRERVALYILALDAINFCFWPSREDSTQINSLEYDHLAVALKQLAEDDDKIPSKGDSNHGGIVRSDPSYAFSPQNLASMTPGKMASRVNPYLQGHYMDNMKKRSELWKELGTVLLDKYDGSATQFLERAENDATKLVDLIYSSFPGFQDEAEIEGQRIFFLKRAQIFVGDVNAALKLNLKSMESLTTFADYRVPQILRHFLILDYSVDLTDTVDSQTEIAKGSPHEIAIRAATVVAVEELVKFLNNDISANGSFTDVIVDWYLWQVGEKMNQLGQLKPFHKVRTHFY